MRCQTLVNDYFVFTFRSTCDPMLLLRIEIRMLIKDLTTTIGILVRVLTPAKLAEWVQQFHTIWQRATHWVEGFHLGKVQLTIWQAAILAVKEKNA